MIKLIDLFNNKKTIQITLQNNQVITISKIFALAYDGKVNEFIKELANESPNRHGVNQSLVTWIAYSRKAGEIQKMLSAFKQFHPVILRIDYASFKQLDLVELVKSSFFLEKNYPHSTVYDRDPMALIASFIAGSLGDEQYVKNISIDNPKICQIQWALCGATLSQNAKFISQVFDKGIKNEADLHEPIKEHSLTNQSPLAFAVLTQNFDLATVIGLRMKEVFGYKLFNLAKLNDLKGIEENLHKAITRKIPIEQDLIQWIYLSLIFKNEKADSSRLLEHLYTLGASPLLSLSEDFVSNSLKTFKGVEDFIVLAPLEVAILKKYKELVDIMLKHCKDKNEILNHTIQRKPYNGFKFIHLAAFSGNREIIESLIGLGANLSTPVEKTNPAYKGYHPIHIAISKGHHEIVKMLIQEYNVHPLSRVDRESAIELAKKISDEKMVKILYESLSDKEKEMLLKLGQPEAIEPVLPSKTGRMRKLLPNRNSFDQVLKGGNSQEIAERICEELKKDHEFLLQYCSPTENTLKILRAVIQYQEPINKPNILQVWGQAILEKTDGTKEFWKEAHELFQKFTPKNTKRKNSNTPNLNDSFKRRALLAENTSDSKALLLNELLPPSKFNWIKRFEDLRKECKTQWKNGKSKINEADLFNGCSNELLSSYNELKKRSNAFLLKAQQEEVKFCDPHQMIIAELCSSSITINPLKIQDSVNQYYNEKHDNLLQVKNEVEKSLSNELTLLKNELSQVISSLHQEKAQRAFQLRQNHYLSMLAPDEKFASKKRNIETSLEAIASLWNKRSEELKQAQTVEQLEVVDSKYREELQKKFTSKKNAKALEELDVIQDLQKQRAADQKRIEELLQLISLQQRTIEQLQKTPHSEPEEPLAASIPLLHKQIKEELITFEPKSTQEEKLKKKFNKDTHPLKSLESLIQNYKRMGYTELTREGGGSHRHFTYNDTLESYQYITIANHTNESTKAEIQTGLQATLAYIKQKKGLK